MLEKKTQDAAILEAMHEMTAAVVNDCEDIELLDLVYKLLVTPTPEPKPKEKPKPAPKPELTAGQIAFYREELAKLTAEAPGYILAMAYGFITALMEE